MDGTLLPTFRKFIRAILATDRLTQHPKILGETLHKSVRPVFRIMNKVKKPPLDNSLLYAIERDLTPEKKGSQTFLHYLTCLYKFGFK